MASSGGSGQGSPMPCNSPSAFPPAYPSSQLTNTWPASSFVPVYFTSTTMGGRAVLGQPPLVSHPPHYPPYPLPSGPGMVAPGAVSSTFQPSNPSSMYASNNNPISYQPPGPSRLGLGELKKATAESMGFSSSLFAAKAARNGIILETPPSSQGSVSDAKKCRLLPYGDPQKQATANQQCAVSASAQSIPVVIATKVGASQQSQTKGGVNSSNLADISPLAMCSGLFNECISQQSSCSGTEPTPPAQVQISPFGRIKKPVEIKAPDQASSPDLKPLNPTVPEFSPNPNKTDESDHPDKEDGNQVDAIELEVFDENVDEIENAVDPAVANENSNNNSTEDEGVISKSDIATGQGWSTWKHEDTMDWTLVKEDWTLVKEDWAAPEVGLAEKQRHKSCQTDSSTQLERRKGDHISSQAVRDLQAEVCQLRAQLCLNELQRKRFSLELDAYWWNANFISTASNRLSRTMLMTQEQLQDIMDQMRAIEMQRDQCLSVLSSGQMLRELPNFSITVPCGEALVPLCSAGKSNLPPVGAASSTSQGGRSADSPTTPKSNKKRKSNGDKTPSKKDLDKVKERLFELKLNETGIGEVSKSISSEEKLNVSSDETRQDNASVQGGVGTDRDPPKAEAGDIPLSQDNGQPLSERCPGHADVNRTEDLVPSGTDKAPPLADPQLETHQGPLSIDAGLPAANRVEQEENGPPAEALHKESGLENAAKSLEPLHSKETSLAVTSIFDSKEKEKKDFAGVASGEVKDQSDSASVFSEFKDKSDEINDSAVKIDASRDKLNDETNDRELNATGPSTKILDDNNGTDESGRDSAGVTSEEVKDKSASASVFSEFKDRRDETNASHDPAEENPAVSESIPGTVTNASELDVHVFCKGATVQQEQNVQQDKELDVLNQDSAAIVKGLSSRPEKSLSRKAEWDPSSEPFTKEPPLTHLKESSEERKDDGDSELNNKVKAKQCGKKLRRGVKRKEMDMDALETDSESSEADSDSSEDEGQDVQTDTQSTVVSSKPGVSALPEERNSECQAESLKTGSDPSDALDALQLPPDSVHPQEEMTAAQLSDCATKQTPPEPDDRSESAPSIPKKQSFEGESEQANCEATEELAKVDGSRKAVVAASARAEASGETATAEKTSVPLDPQDSEKVAGKGKVDAEAVLQSVTAKLRELYPEKSLDPVWLQETAQEQTLLFLQQLELASSEYSHVTSAGDAQNQAADHTAVPQQQACSQASRLASPSPGLQSKPLQEILPPQRDQGNVPMPHRIPASRREFLMLQRDTALAQHSKSLEKARGIEQMMLDLNQHYPAFHGNSNMAAEVTKKVNQYQMLLDDAHQASLQAGKLDRELKALLASQASQPGFPPNPLLKAQQGAQPEAALHSPHPGLPPPFRASAYASIAAQYPSFQPKFAPQPFHAIPRMGPHAFSWLNPSVQPQLKGAHTVPGSVAGTSSSLPYQPVPSSVASSTALSSHPAASTSDSIQAPLLPSLMDVKVTSTLCGAYGGKQPLSPSHFASSSSSAFRAISEGPALNKENGVSDTGSLSAPVSGKSTPVTQKKGAQAGFEPSLLSSNLAAHTSTSSPPAFKPLLPLKPIKFSTNRYAALASTACFNQQTSGLASGGGEETLQKKKWSEVASDGAKSKQDGTSRSGAEDDWQLAGAKKHCKGTVPARKRLSALPLTSRFKKLTPRSSLDDDSTLEGSGAESLVGSESNSSVASTVPQLDDFHFSKPMRKEGSAKPRLHINTNFIDQLVRNNAASNVGKAGSTRSSSSRGSPVQMADVELESKDGLDIDSQKSREGDDSEWRKVEKKGSRSKHCPEGPPAASLAAAPPKEATPGKITAYKKLYLSIEQEFPNLKTVDITQVITRVKDSYGGHFHGKLFSDIMKDIRLMVRRDFFSKPAPALLPMPSSMSTATLCMTDEEECSICLLDLNIGLKYSLDCGHSFHKSCIDKWVKQQGERTCPNCRTMVLLNEEFPRLTK